MFGKNFADMHSKAACYECLVSFLKRPKCFKSYSFCPYHLIFSFFKSEFTQTSNKTFYCELPCDCKIFSLEANYNTRVKASTDKNPQEVPGPAGQMVPQGARIDTYIGGDYPVPQMPDGILLGNVI